MSNNKLKINHREEVLSNIKIIDDYKTKIHKLNKLYVYDNNKNIIFILSLNYALLSDNIFYDGSLHRNNYIIDNNIIHSEILITASENFEVKYIVKCGDSDNKDILVNTNINIYKRPHTGWNFRLYDNIKFLILNNGDSKLWTYRDF